MKTLLSILLIILLCQCSVIPKDSGYRIKITKEPCNPYDRHIVGISKNQKYYLVIDGCGRPAPRIRVEDRADSTKIGMTLRVKREFQFGNY